MIGCSPIGTTAISELPIEPAKTEDGLTDQLVQMRSELPPSVINRWGHVIDGIIESLRKRGRKRTDRDAARDYMQEQIDQGRVLDANLITEAAKEMLCSRKTAKRAAEELTQRQK